MVCRANTRPTHLQKHAAHTPPCFRHNTLKQRWFAEQTHDPLTCKNMQRTCRHACMLAAECHILHLMPPSLLAWLLSAHSSQSPLRMIRVCTCVCVRVCESREERHVCIGHKKEGWTAKAIEMHKHRVAITFYIYCIFPYIWWLPCQKTPIIHRVYITIHINIYMVLANPTYIVNSKI